MPFFERDRATIHYEVQGEGYPVLLFAPGFLSSRIERWWTNPAKPGVPQAWSDPIPVLAKHFRVITLDVRNAGESVGAIGAEDGWHTYTEDHVALVDHLGVRQCHVMGACIGVSFALALAEARPGLVTALVLQNPIGIHGDNRRAIEHEFELWAAQMAQRPDVDPGVLPGIGRRMFGGDFIFSVSRDAVARCGIPSIIMGGNDEVHPAATADELARLLPGAEVLDPWKGPDHRDAAMERVRDFLLAIRR